MSALLRTIVLTLWRLRLGQAKRYRAGIERVTQAAVDQAMYVVELARAEQEAEIAKAQFDVDFCQQELAKAEREEIEARANRRLAKVTA